MFLKNFCHRLERFRSGLVTAVLEMATSDPEPAVACEPAFVWEAVERDPLWLTAIGLLAMDVATAVVWETEMGGTGGTGGRRPPPPPPAIPPIPLMMAPMTAGATCPITAGIIISAPGNVLVSSAKISRKHRPKAMQAVNLKICIFFRTSQYKVTGHRAMATIHIGVSQPSDFGLLRWIHDDPQLLRNC